MSIFGSKIVSKHCVECKKERRHEIIGRYEQTCLACNKMSYFLDRPLELTNSNITNTTTITFYNHLVQEYCVKCNRSTTQSRGNDITMCKECGYFVDSKTGLNKDTIKDCYDSDMLLDLHTRVLKNF